MWLLKFLFCGAFVDDVVTMLSYMLLWCLVEKRHTNICNDVTTTCATTSQQRVQRHQYNIGMHGVILFVSEIIKYRDIDTVALIRR